ASLSHELQAQAATAELTASKQVRVGVVGDFEFANLFASGSTGTAEDAVVARMNIVDGIFTSQLGVKVSLASTQILRDANEPFTKTVPADLLSELRSYRAGSPAQLALGLTHLMTGRDLSGDTVGIAYIGSVCDGANAASLSEGRRSTTQSALIAAHEIGHNFGAPHDGETGACQSTPQTFLMAPRLNGSDQFSACSVAQMQPYINNSRCLTAYMPPDAGLEIGMPSVQAQTGTAFVASFLVRAFGDDASNAVSVTATLPTSVTIASVTANGGTCTSGAGTATCMLGTLAAGDTRQVDLNLTATESGSVTVNLQLDSANDSNSSNDAGAITISASGNPVASPNPPPTGGSTNGGGGGGGGRMDFTALALLMATLGLRCWPGFARFRRVAARRVAVRDERARAVRST
ncbi:MAG TPA: zinc-dependent metalloprotease family protein, partial [Steroidobacteraceae bacterium]|nr:zinc-dependent metalloprotease family protein [Steroidobacteraceae bacterium]